MMMMNCYCGMVDRRKAFSLISSRDHCQRFSSSRISDTPRAGFEPEQNLSSGFVEWSCAIVITTTPRRHKTLHEAGSGDTGLKFWRTWCNKFSFIKLLLNCNFTRCSYFSKGKLQCPANIYLFKVDNRNTRKRCETSFWFFYF